ncbi:MAG TPA: hypothetical protein VFJ70_11305, partial [Burkholderiales bacterium]|nr:hypothetical protein [Burkholderiales bacterium]
MDAPLLLGDRLNLRIGLAPLLAALLAIAAITPVAAAATAALGIAFTLGTRRLLFRMRRLRMLLGRPWWLRRALLLLLRLRALFLPPALALAATLFAPLASLLAVTPLLEPPVLLAIAAASVAIAIVSALVAPAAVPPLLLIASLVLAAWLAVLRRLDRRCRRLRRSLHGCGRRRHLEKRQQAGEEADAGTGRCGDRLCELHRLGRFLALRLGRERSGLRGRDALHHGLLALHLGFGGLGARRLRLLGLLDHLVARGHVLHLVQLLVAQALHLVVRRLEVLVGHHYDIHLQPRFQLLDLGALLVQQERGDVHRH